MLFDSFIIYIPATNKLQNGSKSAVLLSAVTSGARIDFGT